MTDIVRHHHLEIRVKYNSYTNHLGNYDRTSNASLLNNTNVYSAPTLIANCKCKIRYEAHLTVYVVFFILI